MPRNNRVFYGGSPLNMWLRTRNLEVTVPITGDVGLFLGNMFSLWYMIRTWNVVPNGISLIHRTRTWFMFERLLTHGVNCHVDACILIFALLRIRWLHEVVVVAELFIYFLDKCCIFFSRTWKRAEMTPPITAKHLPDESWGANGVNAACMPLRSILENCYNWSAKGHRARSHHTNSTKLLLIL